MTPTAEDAASAAALPLRDRLIIWAGLAVIAALCWFYLVQMSHDPSFMGSMDMPGMSMPPQNPFAPAALWLNFVMWAVMMVAMMTPTAEPMVMMFARLARGRGVTGPWNVVAFVAGYLMAWTLYSAAATIAQAVMQHATLLSSSMRLRPTVGELVLIAAGVYQLSSLKDACLKVCRSPLSFFMLNWHEGSWGATRMGLEHGVFCIGCCWLLMGLLFVAGVMNLVWVGILTAIALIEKVAPQGDLIARGLGVLMVGGGLWMALVTWALI